LLSVAASGLAYAVMVFVMTATPLSMHHVDGHTMNHTASVIQAHIIAMFAPSFVSGRLIARFGETRVMWLGLTAFGSCLAIAALGHEVIHYAASLVLLGVGWNFLFVGATSLLVRQYSPEERGRAEAINDFAVFSLAATSSLLSGTALHHLGWTGLLGLAVIPTLLLLIALLWYRTQSPSPIY
jgi:MFS family permease